MIKFFKKLFKKELELEVSDHIKAVDKDDVFVLKIKDFDPGNTYIRQAHDQLTKMFPGVKVLVISEDSDYEVYKGYLPFVNETAVDSKSFDAPTCSLSDNAVDWANEFIETMKREKWKKSDIDKSLMVTWFANAIECSMDVREKRKHMKHKTSCLQNAELRDSLKKD